MEGEAIRNLIIEYDDRTRLGFGTGVRALPRFAGWQRALRASLLSMDDIAQVLRAVGGRGRSARTAAVSTLDPGIGLETTQPTSGLDPAGEVLMRQHAVDRNSRWGSWTSGWAGGDWLAVGLGAVCLALILSAPWLTEHSISSALSLLATELHLFPGGN